ncbi:hypothetical protein DFS34DRAFT_262556 [Phlyctochytrium arcticum]|nr:hypothetical protein DFS34DRAFT_262556 [Phlyctochytrium arcticum]
MVTCTLLLGAITAILFFIGVRNGPGAAQREPVHFIVPWMILSFATALIDSAISICIIGISRDMTAMLRAKDVGHYNINSNTVGEFTRRNRAAAICTIVGNISFGSLYGVATMRNLGNTLTYTGAITYAASWWFFTYSLTCLRSTETANPKIPANAANAVNPVPVTHHDLGFGLI